MLTTTQVEHIKKVKTFPKRYVIAAVAALPHAIIKEFMSKEEGSKCSENCDGIIELKKADNCSCHISPPCSGCTDAPLYCPICHWEEEIERINGFIGKRDESGVVHNWVKRTLDKTKIDWHYETHTHFTMKKVGVYPESATMKDVEDLVKGTFGGRFEYFRDGKFSYVAYTD